MRQFDELERMLHEMDGKGYGAYKSIKGSWTDGVRTLVLDHVQGDPFASPSRGRIRIPTAEHGIPRELWQNEVRRVALCDFLLRVFGRATRDMPKVPGSGKSGAVMVDDGDAQILGRSGCHLDEEGLEVRFRVGLPAKGRSVLGRAAATLLTRYLPEAAESIFWEALDPNEVQRWVELAEDHAQLQDTLRERGLVAFVRDGSVLPRKTGVSSKPLSGAVPFETPEAYRVTLPTSHHGEVTGMGIPEGVTLITGGGFHGKTTLLEAIQYGVYPHVPGDGREWVVTRDDALKVRSEDGRAVSNVDLVPFIHDLPGDKDTSAFSTQDASGSTSLAASILESLEAQSRFLLLDEDTCATNLLIRDARMQALVARETIVPLVDRIRELYDRLGVSTLLVLGGSGDYLDVADQVILLEHYLPHDATERARSIAGDFPTRRATGGEATPLRVTTRCPKPGSFDPRRGDKEKIRTHGRRELSFGEQEIDLTALEQLVDDSQARAIGALLKEVGRVAREGLPLREALEEVLAAARSRGLYAIEPQPELAMPRLYELAGAVNRLRSLKVRQQTD